MHLQHTLATLLVFVTLAAPGVLAVRRSPRQQHMQEDAELTAPTFSLIQMDLHAGKDKESCFERIAIGRRLADVTISTPISMLIECEEKCFTNVDCRAFSFGIGRFGNGTCEMQFNGAAERRARQRGRLPRKLEPTQQPEDPDYDLFERRANCEPPDTMTQKPTQKPASAQDKPKPGAMPDSQQVSALQESGHPTEEHHKERPSESRMA